jgi:queuosine biosynthesis protein QueD
MYEKLTGKAQRGFKYAREEAERMGHQYIGTEHLLLGLVREGTGVAVAVLQRLGVDPKRVRPEVEKIVKGGSDVVPADQQFALAPRAKKAFEYALEEAKRLGQNYVGTEHILLGLLRDGECAAARVLGILGVGADSAREAIEALLGKQERPGPPPASPPVGEPHGTFELTVEGEFAAAHNLRQYEGDCERLHGHNWRVRVCLSADELNGLGMVADFRDVKAALAAVLEALDHRYLNEVAPFDKLNPTTENLCRHIAEGLREKLPRHISIRRVTCWESDRCSASYLP